MLSSSIELDALPPELATEVKNLIDRYETKHLARDSWRYVLDHGTDEEIMEKARGECIDNAPLIFARDCPPDVGERYSRIREVLPIEFVSHPRRVVAMRGARLVRYWKYSFSPCASPNGWAYRVFLRALRMSKKTLLDHIEIYDFMRDLAVRVAERHHRVDHHYFSRCRPRRTEFGHDQRLVLMSGKLVGVPHSSVTNLERMLNIIRKTDKLDERMRLARESRRY